MKNNQFEYRGNKFTIALEPKEKIVTLKDWGGIDEKKALEMKEKIIEFLEKIPPDEPKRLLLDVEKYVKVTPEARRILFSLVKTMREKKVKIALVTSSPAVRVVAKFIGFAVADLNSFVTKKEAIKWLKK